MSIATDGRERLKVALRDGDLRVTGTDAAGGHVDAVGKIMVKLVGQPGSYGLVFVVTGLPERVQALGVTSPFGSATNPVRIPVKVTDSPSGCS